MCRLRNSTWVGQRGKGGPIAVAGRCTLSCPSRAEGMSLALLEGMAWDLAVVTTAVGGSQEFLRNDQNCIIVAPNDPPGISSAMMRLVECEELRSRLGREARYSEAFRNRRICGAPCNSLSRACTAFHFDVAEPFAIALVRSRRVRINDSSTVPSPHLELFNQAHHSAIAPIDILHHAVHREAC